VTAAARDDVADATWVVVPAYDEGPVVAKTLASLAALPYDPGLADDGSSDDTARREHDVGATVLRQAGRLRRN
jgi:polyprenyl-phospho-N-acetylgalactosaminyl synthase